MTRYSRDISATLSVTAIEENPAFVENKVGQVSVSVLNCTVYFLPATESNSKRNRFGGTNASFFNVAGGAAPFTTLSARISLSAELPALSRPRTCHVWAPEVRFTTRGLAVVPAIFKAPS